MALFENFPWTNLHQLNLNWLIEEVKKCYSPDNPPEAMVISVNGESGVVTLYRDAHVNLPDITEEQWNIYRGSANKITGIEFNKDNPATRINGNQRFVIYDAGNPPPYPVIAVNGETGNVILYEEPYAVFPDVEGDNWGIERKLNTNAADETRVGIMFDDTGKAYITHDEDATQILTIEDIPASSGVVSVNGKSGVVLLYASDIPISSQNNQTTKQAIDNINTEISIIDTAINNTNIALNNNVNRIDTEISNINDDISGINTDISNINNDISGINTDISNAETDISNAEINIQNNTTAITNIQTAMTTIANHVAYAPTYCYAQKKLGMVCVYGHSAGGLTLTGDGQWHQLTTLPEGYRPSTEIYFAGATVDGRGISFHIDTTGIVEYVLNSNTAYWNFGGFFLT